MANFPSPHRQNRAPRVQLPIPQAASFAVDGRKVQARLLKLSMTGGLARIEATFAADTLANMAFTTPEGTIRGVVAFITPNNKAERNAQPFRFVALDDGDQARLSASLEVMRAHQVLRSLI
jgi:hypothetical protein